MKALVPAAGRIALGLLIAGLLFGALRSLPPLLFFGSGADSPAFAYVDFGEALLHRVDVQKASVSYHLPSSSILAALLFNHTTPQSFKSWRVLIVAASVLLVLSLGCLLGPPAASVPALAYLILCPDVIYARTAYIHFFFSLLLLLIAGLMIWRAQAPSWRRSLILGLALGASLLYRSPLFLFPPILAAFEWNFRYGRSLRAYWKHALALCMTPYLILIPWIRMNWVVHREIIPFEHNEATPNIISGAVGMVLTSEGDWKSQAILEDTPGGAGGANVYGWAARQIVLHPARYARAFVSRIRYAIGQHPVLCLLSAMALWVHRRRRGFGELGLLAAYYLGIHCLMAVQEGYFRPLWPLLSVISASLAIRFLSVGPVAPEGLAYRLSVGWIRVCLVIVLGFAGFVAWTVDSYARRARLRPPSSVEAWAEAIAQTSDDAWLWFESGKRRLGRGEIRRAVAEMREAVALRPWHFERRLELGRALMLEGNSQALLQLEFPKNISYAFIEEDLRVLKAYGYLTAGRREEARVQLRHALDARDPRIREVQEFRPPDKDDERQRYAAAEFLDKARVLLGPFPLERRLALAGELARIAPSQPSFWLELASLAARAKQPRLALQALARAENLKVERFEMRRMVELYANLGSYGRSVEILEALSRRSSEQAEIWIAEAQKAVLQGRRVWALRCLARAESLEPSDDQARRVAHLYGELGERHRSLEIMASLRRKYPEAAELWILEGEIAAGGGKRGWALKAFAQAARLNPAMAEWHRIAMGYQEIKEYRLALQILHRLVEEHPGHAVLLKDRGLCLYLSGSTDRAVRDIQAAISMDPDLLPAYLTLAAIHAAAKRYPEALEVYDRALSVDSRAEHEPLRQAAIRGRAEILTISRRMGR